MRWALLAVALLVLAGCTSPLGSDEPATTTTTGATMTTGTTTGTATTGPDPGPDAPPANRTWPEPEAAKIRPGVQMITPKGQCTSNFIFTDPSGARVFIGFAAHCVAETSGVTSTGGCDDVTPLELGSAVEIEGAATRGRLVYSSWLTMQERGESDANACRYNDFALVELAPGDAKLTSPAVRFYGGPTEMADAGEGSLGGRVLTYGNSGTRLGMAQLHPREGIIVGHGGGDWTTTIYTETPGVPGDSGSAVLHKDGRALGILVTVAYAPLTGSNGVTSLDRALNYANAYSGQTFVLATWEQLDDGLLP